jgi:hypothetical protein
MVTTPLLSSERSAKRAVGELALNPLPKSLPFFVSVVILSGVWRSLAPNEVEGPAFCTISRKNPSLSREHNTAVAKGDP